VHDNGNQDDQEYGCPYHVNLTELGVTVV